MPSLWDPESYLRYEEARLRPALDLLARIHLEGPAHIVDLGCGAGNVTSLLEQRWPDAQLLGLDNSAEMLDRARQRSSRIEWRLGDIAQLDTEAPVDLLFSNAALHWLEDHRELFPQLISQLSSTGVLAVQMPLSYDLPSHMAIREVLAETGADGEPIGDEELRSSMARRPVESPAFYYRLLRPLFSQLAIWSTEYLQALEGEDPVLEWVSATGLRPVLQQLPTPRRDLFMERYRARLRELYRTEADGRVLFPFPRLFLVGRRT